VLNIIIFLKNLLLFVLFTIFIISFGFRFIISRNISVLNIGFNFWFKNYKHITNNLNAIYTIYSEYQCGEIDIYSSLFLSCDAHATVGEPAQNIIYFLRGKS